MESNHRPQGYEPCELPLLYPAERPARIELASSAWQADGLGSVCEGGATMSIGEGRAVGLPIYPWSGRSWFALNLNEFELSSNEEG